jgi:hypothetical protein
MPTFFSCACMTWASRICVETCGWPAKFTLSRPVMPASRSSAFALSGFGPSL